MTTRPQANKDVAARLLEAHAKSTQGTWNLTRYGGGINFNSTNPLKCFCGTDTNYGEPRKMPATEADNEFIALAHNLLPELLAASDRWDREFEALKAFVEDVRDSKLRATNDEECVMAFVRLGNRAGELMVGLAQEKASEET